MSKEMLINSLGDQEVRIAIVQDGRLEELYTERASSASHVGNIYKGRISNVEPSIQAAFVDFGLPKNGFLHISDVHPKFFPNNKQDVSENVGKKRPHYTRPPIQECLRRGQEVVVQMTKEGIGTKGPTMTTYLSIPGRMLVMMPGMSRLGVSRKIEDDDERSQARLLLNELKLPDDMGFILRTAGIGRPKRDLQRDLHYLMRLWKSVKERIKSEKAPIEIYQESDLIIRTMRDVYNSDIKRVICDTEEAARKVNEFLSVSMPRTKHDIAVYEDRNGLFHDFNLEAEIEKIYAHRVELPSGGSLVIDQTEALVAIDVNSGRYREHSNAEMTALKINQEAANEIARQLRLRDMGGVIIVDFIDMREDKHRRAVEKTLREAMKPDRAKTKVLRISSFGIIEMTRQRMRPSLKSSIYTRCEHCEGTGQIKSGESQAMIAIRMLQRAVNHEDVCKAEIFITPTAAYHLNNFHRNEISRIEKETGKIILVQSDPTLKGEEMRLVCTNARDSEVAWDRNPLNEKGKKQPRIVPLEEMEKTPSSGPDLSEEFDGLPDEEPAPESLPEKPEQVLSSPPAAETSEKKKKSRRRGRRGGRKHRNSPSDPMGTPPSPSAEIAPKEHPGSQDIPAQRPELRPMETAANTADQPVRPEVKSTGEAVTDGHKSKSRRRRRSRKKSSEKASAPAAPVNSIEPPPAAVQKATVEEPLSFLPEMPKEDVGPTAHKKNRKRHSRRSARKSAEVQPENAPAAEPPPQAVIAEEPAQRAPSEEISDAPKQKKARRKTSRRPKASPAHSAQADEKSPPSSEDA